VKSAGDEYILSLLRNAATFEQGFALLMQTFQEQLYRHIRRMVHDHEDANDVLQNTFIKVFRGFHTFEEKSKLYTWLYRIASNESLTFLQKKKASISIDGEGNGAWNQLHADVYFDADAAQLLLKNAIESLPDKQKLVFNMRYYDEMPYEEMSAVLETSVGALKASFHHAVKKIERFVQENKGGGVD
jgi:RNA polymerase sigma-70 factor (ECF subfamily)